MCRHVIDATISRQASRKAKASASNYPHLDNVQISYLRLQVLNQLLLLLHKLVCLHRFRVPVFGVVFTRRPNNQGQTRTSEGLCRTRAPGLATQHIISCPTT